ncbi:MAG: helix-turn-helix domain-containing protein [Eubacterium sp.]|nr:helix-turn-helix domain-containing protein [Eubacterium sp.]
MDISTANRLFEYRKAYGYSQEELAEKIGVSRQAISKWERSESSPDTDNLIALSKLYGVTIDELLNGNEKPKKVMNNENVSDESVENADPSAEAPKTDNIHIGWDGIHVESKNGDKVHIGGGHGVHVETGDESWKSYYADDKRKIHPKRPPRDPVLHAALPIVLIIVYLILGFTFSRGWAVGWIVFLLIPIIETGIAAFKYKNPAYFAYPVLAAGLFLTSGMVFHVWHPTWIIFLTIPLYYLVCDAYRKTKQLKEDDYSRNPQNSNGTYFQPDGTSYSEPTRGYGNNVARVIIIVVCAITIIAVVAIICTFSWLGGVSGNGFISGIVDIVDSAVGNSNWSYDNWEAYTVGNGEVIPQGITQLSVDWINGNVTAQYYDGDTIAFSEPEQENSDHQLRWLVVGNELKIKFCKSGLKWQNNNHFYNKDLTIYLPNGFNPNEIGIDTVSANIDINGIKASGIDIDTVSGNINVRGEFAEIDADTVSGNIIADGSFASISADAVSGHGDITARNKPNKMELETVSGFFKVTVPEDISGFTVTYDTVSGNASVRDFEVKIPEKRMIVYGDGSARIDFESVSGNLEIKKAS